MVSAISGGTGLLSQAPAARKAYGNAAQDETSTRVRTDELTLGKGNRLSDEERTQIVVERALARLRSVVDDAKEELGIAPDAELDTSPEATADRIANFALGFWDKYAAKHGLENNEEGRKAFADFIGGAITQGIDEARGILGALSALNGDVSSNIDKTASIITNRLDEFVKKGL